MWTGLKFNETSKEWRWINGDLATDETSFWGENRGNEFCAAVDANGLFTITINCNENAYAACEIPIYF